MSYCMILYHEGFCSSKLLNLKRPALDFSPFTVEKWTFKFGRAGVTQKYLVIEKCSILDLKALIDGCLAP